MTGSPCGPDVGSSAKKVIVSGFTRVSDIRFAYPSSVPAIEMAVYLYEIHLRGFNLPGTREGGFRNDSPPFQWRGFSMAGFHSSSGSDGWLPISDSAAVRASISVRVRFSVTQKSMQSDSSG